MKRKERKQCSVPVASMLRIRKERITYRCLVLPPSPQISHGSLLWSIVNTPAPPSSAVARGSCATGGRGRIRGKKGTECGTVPSLLTYTDRICCVWHPRTSPTRHKEWIITISSSPWQMRDDPRSETSLAEEQNGKPASWRAAGATVTVGRLLINSWMPALHSRGPNSRCIWAPCRHPTYRRRPHSQSLK